MSDTASRFLQSEIVLEQLWDWRQDSLSLLNNSSIPAPDPPRTESLTNAGLLSEYPAETTSPVSQSPAAMSDWRAELRARYRAMPETAWFKAAHENRSLGEAIKVP